MARIDTLNHFLTDVADAIRDKKGTSGQISASEFDTEIASISGGGEEDLNGIEELVTMGAKRTKEFEFSFSTPECAKIILSVDDCLPNAISKAVTNADAKNVPLTMCAISSYFDDYCTSGDHTKTVAEEIARGVSNGGEVWMHGNGAITEDNVNDESLLKQKFLNEKLIFANYGFTNVRGFDVIGGGSQVYNHPKTDRWVRALYDYSDGYGIGAPYNLFRYAPTTLESAKTQIDNAVANNGIIIIYAHKWYDFWNDMIDYAVAEGAEFTTFAEVYDTYGVKTRVEPTQKVLASISATKTKTSYYTDETFSAADVTVTATYDDSSTADVTASASIGTVDITTTGTKTLSISYTEDGVTKTTTISISVSERPAVKTLSSISATKTKVSYEVGETFSTSDVVVTAHYSDDTTATVTSSANIGTVDTSTEGAKTLEISYTEDGVTKTTTIAITVASSGKTYLTNLYKEGARISSGVIGNHTPDALSYVQIEAGKTYNTDSGSTSGFYYGIDVAKGTSVIAITFPYTASDAGCIIKSDSSGTHLDLKIYEVS